MSEVEALLSVDAGRVPPGAVVFPAADPEAPTRRLYAFLALAVGGFAVGCGVHAVGAEAVALLVTAAAIFAVLALPPSPEPEEARNKRPTLVVTTSGIIVRDESGLRTWRFDELASVRPYSHAGGEGLLLVRHDGSREFLDSLCFRRGEFLGEVIRQHVALQD
jgi:hypothetical protein